MADSSSTDLPAGITCERYTRGANGKRCRHYAPQGQCALSHEPCVEWVKVNSAGRRTERRPTDLFGDPVREAASSCSSPAKPLVAGSAALRAPRAAEGSCEVTAGQISSFRELRVEICIHADGVGEMWLVPSYTGQPRKEITPEHVATVGRVLAAFPGARVLAMEPAAPAEGSSAWSRS